MTQKSTFTGGDWRDMVERVFKLVQFSGPIGKASLIMMASIALAGLVIWRAKTIESPWIAATVVSVLLVGTLNVWLILRYSQIHPQTGLLDATQQLAFARMQMAGKGPIGPADSPLTGARDRDMLPSPDSDIRKNEG